MRHSETEAEGMYGRLWVTREHMAIGEEEAPTGLSTGDVRLGEWQC